MVGCKQGCTFGYKSTLQSLFHSKYHPSIWKIWILCKFNGHLERTKYSEPWTIPVWISNSIEEVEQTARNMVCPQVKRVHARKYRNWWRVSVSEHSWNCLNCGWHQVDILRPVWSSEALTADVLNLSVLMFRQSAHNCSQKNRVGRLESLKLVRIWEACQACEVKAGPGRLLFIHNILGFQACLLLNKWMESWFKVGEWLHCPQGSLNIVAEYLTPENSKIDQTLHYWNNLEHIYGEP